MVTMRTTHVLGCLMGIALLGTVARGQEAEPQFDPLGEQVEAPRLVRVMAEFVDLPHEDLTKLLTDRRISANDTELRKKVQELVLTGAAFIVETMICTAPSGNRATTESIQEFIYPTEYEPAHIPASTHVTAAGITVKSEDPDNSTGPTPTAFDTRNIGSTLEIEPTMSSDHKVIQLRMVPEIVYHLSDKVWSEWFGNQGDASMKMPLFYSMRVTTSVTMMSGQTLLVAALSPKGPDGMPDSTRKVMVFVRCDVLEVGR